MVEVPFGMQIDDSDAGKEDYCEEDSGMSVGSNLDYAAEDHSMHTLVLDACPFSLD